MILTHGANSLKRGGGREYTDFVEIGGLSYPIVKIANQWWIAENLDYKYPGLIINDQLLNNDKALACYYDNNESVYGANGKKYGLLYNQYAVKYLNDNRQSLLPSGWHVPDNSEWDALATALGGSSIAGEKLKSQTEWHSNPGSDEYMFNAIPSGYYGGTRYDYGNFSDLGYTCDIWSINKYTVTQYYYYRLSDNNDEIVQDHYYFWYRFAIRLVKDA